MLPKHDDGIKSLSCRHSISAHRHETSHTYLKGAANHNRVVNEGRAATEIVAVAAILSLGGAGAADSKASEFSHQQKMQQRVMTNRAVGSREAMAREKHTAEPKRAVDFTGQQVKRSERGEEPSEIENKNQEDSVLYQGRKNHDHYSSEGRKNKKYDSEGAKTPWHRNPQLLMVSLSKTEWQSRIPEKVKSSVPDEQSSSETVDKGRSTDSRSLSAKLKGVNGEFGEHLRKVEQRMHRSENWRAITAERAHRHSSAEKKKDLKFQINEDVELYRKSKGESGLDSLTDLEVDEKYEEDMISIDDSEQEYLSDLHDYWERMHSEHEEDVMRYEAALENQEYQNELNDQETERKSRIGECNLNCVNACR